MFRRVVIEDGNALYQARLDRYIAGGDVPISELQAVWRNTTQPGRADMTWHRQLLEAIRRVNQGLAPAQGVRVLAGDPPIDWSRMRTAADVAPFMESRDTHFASVVIDRKSPAPRLGTMTTALAPLATVPLTTVKLFALTDPPLLTTFIDTVRLLPELFQ